MSRAVKKWRKRAQTIDICQLCGAQSKLYPFIMFTGKGYRKVKACENCILKFT